MMYMPFGGLSMFLLIAAVFVFIFLTLKGRKTKTYESPVDILKRRYANGEIDKEQFEEMKKALED